MAVRNPRLSPFVVLAFSVVRSFILSSFVSVGVSIGVGQKQAHGKAGKRGQQAENSVF